MILDLDIFFFWMNKQISLKNQINTQLTRLIEGKKPTNNYNLQKNKHKITPANLQGNSTNDKKPDSP